VEKPTIGGGRWCCCGEEDVGARLVEGDEEDSRGCRYVQSKDERRGYGSVGWRSVRERRRVSGGQIWVHGGAATADGEDRLRGE